MKILSEHIFKTLQQFLVNGDEKFVKKIGMFERSEFANFRIFHWNEL